MSLVLKVLRRALVCALLTIVPFAGVRVVCVDEPARPAHAAVRASSGDCAESCALRAAPGSQTRCALSDGNPLLMLVAFDALLPTDAPAFTSQRVPHTYPDLDTIYDDPALTRFIPPPEA